MFVKVANCTVQWPTEDWELLFDEVGDGRERGIGTVWYIDHYSRAWHDMVVASEVGLGRPIIPLAPHANWYEEDTVYGRPRIGKDWLCS